MAKKSTDPNVFLLPDLGEGIHEAELHSWKIKPGDTVEELQTIAEMETDKALVEVPSPRAGVVKELCGEPGQICNVGEPLVIYEGGEESTSGSAGSTASAPVAAKAEAPKAAAEPEDDGRTIVGSVSAEPVFKAAAGKAVATPAVRRLARDLGIDINTLVGSGLAGRVTEKDVRAASGTSAGSAPAAGRMAAPAHTSSSNGSAAAAAPTPMHIAPPKAGETQRVPLKGVRKTIAQRLRHSVDTAVHFYVFDEADMTKLDIVRKSTAASSGEKLSYLPFIASALCRAFPEFPALNATMDEPKQEVVRHASAHLGIATDTEQGLSVPVLADADTLGVLQIGRGINQLAKSVRDRTIAREQLMGSTFTISNVGSYAGRFATPILNYPEVAILGIGRAKDGVVAKNGGIHVAKMMPLSLGCDHRAVDGAEMARFLARVIQLLEEQPESLLAPTRQSR